MFGGASLAPAEVVPGADAVAEDNHWTGVACGGFFEVVLFFDAALHVKAQVNIPMARTMEGEVRCRDTTHGDWRTKPGSNSLHHVQLWARRHFTPPVRVASGSSRVGSPPS